MKKKHTYQSPHYPGKVSSLAVLAVAAAVAISAPADAARADESAEEAADASASVLKDIPPLKRSTLRNIPRGPGAPDEGTGTVRFDFGAVETTDDRRASGVVMFHEAGSASRDDRESGWQATADSSFTPRLGGVLEEFGGPFTTGEAWLLSSFTPRSANAHLKLNYGPKVEFGIDKRLGIELSSRIQLLPTNIPGATTNPSLTEAFQSQRYDLGVNVGYLGFKLGANYKSTIDEFNEGYKGLDVGLSYIGSSWSTRLSVGEYRRSADQLWGLRDGDTDNYYTFSIGASYGLTRWLSLSGGFRYFDFGDGFGLANELNSDSSTFYLGSRIKF